VYSSGGHELPITIEVLDAQTRQPVTNAAVSMLWNLGHGGVQEQSVTGGDGTKRMKFIAPGALYWTSLMGSNIRWSHAGNVRIHSALEVSANEFVTYQTNLADVYGGRLAWKGKLDLKYTVLLHRVETP
jgi:hypothetical protein